MGSLAKVSTQLTPLVKMRFLLLLAGLVAVARADIMDEFEVFAKKFSKLYQTGEERDTRRDIFLDNFRQMEEHNELFKKGLVSWDRKVHPYMDFTEEEFVKARMGLPPINKTSFTQREPLPDLHHDNNAPAYFSWVDQGGVTSIKNQGQCGSCAAFSTMATLETCFWQMTGVLYDDLSEQHILDCAYGHNYIDDDGYWSATGCQGAWPQAYYDWLQHDDNGWTQMEKDYPYRESTDGYCRQQTVGFYDKAVVTGQYNKWDSTEDDLQDLVLTVPVSTSVQATYWGDYNSGVYDDYRCCDQDTDPNCKWSLNHAVTVVGYGHDTASGKDYWLVKNSWGSWFGENGYIKVKRGTGHCGIGRLHITAPYCRAV